MTDDLCEVCITAPGLEWLTDLTSWLVTNRLAAGGHITAAVHAIYRWNGAVHDHQEARVALHTRRSLVDDIVAVATARHPFKVPGVFVLPLLGGSPAYDQWVRDQTAGVAPQSPVVSAT